MRDHSAVTAEWNVTVTASACFTVMETQDIVA